MVNRSLIGAAMLLGVCACSDDHFDIVADPTGGNQTIWQNIQANEQLTSFAEILKNTRVMSDERDVKARQTYDDLLNQSQTLTVWAPLNGTFDAQYYLDQLAEAKALWSEDSIAAAKKEYLVSNQFVRNHIARFNYEGGQGQQDVRMMNAKLCFYNPATQTFNGVPMSSEFTSQHASNGMLHYLQGNSPFAYNVYDYMAFDENLAQVYGIISAEDNTVFSAASSTEGAMNENGEMVYVDSVYVTSNELLSYSNALIKNEDSVYVALVPSNEAWEEAYEAVSSLFKFGTSYCYDWNSEDGVFQSTGNNALKLTDKLVSDPSKTRQDSLQDLRTRYGIIQNMFFSPSVYRDVNRTDSASVNHYVQYADSLNNTKGLTFYNKNLGGINPMFEGITPYRASNGYVYVMPHYTVDPAYSFLERSERDAYYLVASTNGCREQNGEPIYLTETDRNPAVKGEFADDFYTYFEVNGNNQLTLRFRLNNILSGHYKISIQMAPNRIHMSHINTDANGDTIVESPKFNARVLSDDLKTVINKAKNNVVINQDQIETIVLWDDFKFPKTYVGLPDGYTSFPVLEIALTLAQQKTGKAKALSIGKIIVEPVRE